MKLNSNYNIIDTFDISNIINEITNLDASVWDLDKSRQNNFGPHIKTKSIFINNIDLKWNGVGYPLETHHINDGLNEHTKKIYNDLEARFDGKVGRTLYINLPVGEKVTPHIDGGYYLMNVHRCHIPIFTNDDVDFLLNNETINMKAGICYEINNGNTHGVHNRGKTDRIHLLIDIIPNKAFIR